MIKKGKFVVVPRHVSATEDDINQESHTEL
jgi:hypothetical protein